MNEKQGQASPEHVVGLASELPPGTHKIVRLRNLEIGVFNVGGVFHALHSMCPHQFGPACAGTVNGEMVCSPATGWRTEFVREGEILTCPWHGMEFDLTTGRCLSTDKMRLRTFPVRVVAGEICLQIGGRGAVAPSANDTPVAGE